jgi:type III secretion protein J
MAKCFRYSLCLVLIMLLAACGKETLYSQLSEQEANEMIALLQRTGIPASKLGSASSSFAVAVERQYFSNAVETLSSSGLPRKRLMNMGEVFEKEGFVSSPLEERARLNFAQSQELTKTIESIDGVVMARVHLALPENDPLTDKQLPSSASVFIKYTPGTDLNKRESQVKALLVNSVEGLPYENVTTVMVPAAMRASVPMVSGASSGGVVTEILAGAVAFLLCVVALLLWHQRRNSNVSFVSKQVIPFASGRKVQS